MSSEPCVVLILMYLVIKPPGPPFTPKIFKPLPKGPVYKIGFVLKVIIYMLVYV